MKYKTLRITTVFFLLSYFLLFTSWHSAIAATTANNNLTTGQIGAVLLILKHRSTIDLPRIDTHPEVKTTVILGKSATFSVTASSNETLTYQWQKNGVDISGAISSSYTIAATTLDDSGAYRVIVKSINGSVISTTAVLFVVNDTIVPTVTVTPLTTSDTSPALSGTVDGTGTAVASVTVVLAGKTYSASVSGTAWSIAKNVISPPLTPGTYEITATAKDAENNTAQDTTSNELLITPGAPILVSALASRTSGVAPLGVFFDAVNKAGVMQPPEVDGHREFADLHYQWDFGDAESGIWAISGKSKNSASGYASAHVYEKPGMYTANLTITDMDGVTANYKMKIEIQNPDTVFAGNSTICFSTGTDFTGCPSGANEVTTNVLTDIQNHVAADRRILLRRGDNWTTAGSISLGTAGPFIVGAFGECQNPDLRGICTNAPLINTTPTSSADEYTAFNINNTNDTRFMDIHIVDAGSGHGAIGGVYEMNQLLLFHLKTTGFITPIGNSHWVTEGHDQVMLVESDASRAQMNIVYIGSKRLAIMGNRLADPDDSHVLRVWHANKAYIAHNEISGSSINSSAGRQALKLHGPSEEELVGATSAIDVNARLATRTRYVVVSDNLFGSSGPWPVTIGPQNSSADERLKDIVLEKNRFFSSYGTLSSSLVQVSLNVAAQYVTLRNNIFDGEGSSRYYAAINIKHEGIESPPLGVRIINNTVYKIDDTDGAMYEEYSAFNVDAAAKGTIIRNNLVQFSTGMAIREIISGSATDVIQDHNLLTDNAGLVDPDNPDHLQKDFALSADSAGINQGVSVPVFKDFNDQPRPLGGTYDVGAFERN